MNNFRSIYNKNIVLLQGPVGWFFDELEKQLIKQNNYTYRILFNSGDDFFSTSKNKVPFKEDLPLWADYFDSFLISEEIDIVILFGDLRIFHKIAIKIAKELNKEVFVFEQGYIRPNFITFEKDGVNYNSKTVPKTKEIFEKMEYSNFYKENIKKESVDIYHSFYYSVKYTFMYGLINFLLSYRYPFYKKNNFYKYNFLSGSVRFCFGKFKLLLFKKKNKLNLNNFIENNKNNYFLIPLQLDEDSQIKYHSKYSNMKEFIEEIIISFSKYSNKNDKLIIKNHPLSIGLKDYSNHIKYLSKNYNVSDRVINILDGDLGKIIKNSKGVVVINSSVGISALYHLKPLKTLGKSIFSVDGLSNENISLNDFWRNYSSPNKKLVSNFMNYLLYNTQMKGSFYIPNNVIENSGK